MGGGRQGGAAEEAKQRSHLLDRIVKVLDTPMDAGGGTLNLLRNGFKQLAARFVMCQFKPETGLNTESVVRGGAGLGDAAGVLLDRRPALGPPRARADGPDGPDHEEDRCAA